MFSKYFHNLLEISQKRLWNQIFECFPETVISWRICLLPRIAVNSGAQKKWKGSKRWNGHSSSPAHMDQGELEARTWTCIHARLHIFALPRRANLSWLGAAWPVLKLKCILGFMVHYIMAACFT